MAAVRRPPCLVIAIVVVVVALLAIVLGVLSSWLGGRTPGYRVVAPPPVGRLVVEQVWSNDDNWASMDAGRRTPGIYGLRGVHSDGTGTGWRAEVCRVGEDGSIESAVGIAGAEDPPNRYFRVVRLDTLGAVGFVGAGHWREHVHAFAADGSARWVRRLPNAINDIAACDWDGDGADEIVVGTGGAAFALSGTGEDLWNAFQRCWVFDVVAAPATGNEPERVLATGVSGLVGLLDEDGRTARWYEFDRGPLRFAVVGSPGEEWRLVGARSSPFILQALAHDGTSQWRVRDNDPRVRRAAISEVTGSPDGKLIAVALKDGLLMFYDASTGDRVGEHRSQHWPYPFLAWRRMSDGSDLLLVASPRGMTAYRVRAGAQ